nr:MAG TPA: hypothetical protein [Caudoviricetes sp.]
MTPDLFQTYKHNYIMPSARLSMKGCPGLSVR